MKLIAVFECVIVLGLASAVLGAIVLGTMATASFARDLEKIRRAASAPAQYREPLIFKASR